MCPSIRAASASAALLQFLRHVQRIRVSIHQGRVGLRGSRSELSSRDSSVCPSIRAASASAAVVDPFAVRDHRPVSIHQGRVGLRGARWRATPASSECVHPSGPRRPPRHAPLPGREVEPHVSIHQGRVGLRGGALDETLKGVNECPSIRAASASAAAHRVGVFDEWCLVSIHQGRVGLRGCRTRKPLKTGHLRGLWRAWAISERSNDHSWHSGRGKNRENQAKTRECERARHPPSPPSHSRRGPREADLSKNTGPPVSGRRQRDPDRCRVPSPSKGKTRPRSSRGL